MSRKMVNMTPHEVTVYDNDGVLRIYPPSGDLARLGLIPERIGNLDKSIALVRSVVDTNRTVLPPKREGIIYIVSSMIGMHCTDRDDFVCPDTGPQSAVRDDSNRIIGIRRFQTFFKGAIHV